MKAPSFAALSLMLAAALVPATARATDQPAPPGDIVAVASASDQLTTLVSAVVAAGLSEALQGAGPFTVFAPTDSAFAKLPAGTLERLLRPESREQLAAILTYHVVPAKVVAESLHTGPLATLNGQEVSVTADSSAVSIGTARVTQADIAASNGVVHLIDAVLLPAAPTSAPATAKPKDHPGH